MAAENWDQLSFSQPSGSVFPKIVEKLQHKGRLSAIAQPKQEDSLFAPVSVPE